MSLSKRLRYEILRRDNHTCRYCGAAAPDVKLTVDHVIPVVLGGGDEPTNLVAACVDCNAGKTSSHPNQQIVEDARDDALRWAAAMSKAAELIMSEVAPSLGYVEAFDRKWSGYTYGFRQDPVPRAADWHDSIRQFYAAGLPEPMMLDAVDTAMGKGSVHVSNVWRYFCGVCWRTIDQMRETAAAILESEDADGT